MTKRVLVVGGSKEFPGAVYLAAITALRSGAESVLVMTPEKVAWVLNTLSPDLMTVKLPGDYLSPEHEPAIREKLKTADILLIGNGVTANDQTQELMRSLVAWNGMKVIDADALKALTENKTEDAILTPNKGEWDLLQKQNDVPTLLQKNVIIVKKGAPTTVVLSKENGEETYDTHPGLEKAGTGDVFAGLIAGYLTQNLSPRFAVKGAIETGNAVAHILTERKQGYFFLASDIVEEIQNAKKLHGV